MKAFHSFWTKPNVIKNNGKIEMSDAELLVLILSALTWRKYNGTIKMITDKAGYEFFQENQLLSVWDECSTELEKIDKSINPFSFWAAGKLYALKSMQQPCVMLDTDMIIWKDIHEYFNTDIVVAHREELHELVYPDPKKFNLKSSYHFSDNWDFTIEATNTAFLFIQDKEFAKYYVDCALDFMNSLEVEDIHPVVSMCFAEQRLLPMCAKEKNKEITCLLDYKKLNEQDFITHLWGAKTEINTSKIEKENFCRRCIQRILKDFSEWTNIIIKNDRFCKYLN